MPGPQITADLLFNIHSQGLSKEIEEALSTGTQRAMRDAKKTVADAFREATVQALTSGKTGDAMKDLAKAGVIEAQQEYLKLQRQLEALEKKALDDKLSTEEKAQMKRLQEQSRATRSLLDDRMKAFKREQEIQRQAAKETRAGASEMAKRFEQGAEGLRSALFGGFGGMARGTRDIGERLRGAGEGRIDRARQMGMKPGADPKQVAQMAKMGRALAGIGAALATVAAVVGVVIVLVKLFADLEAKVKDMNKALIGTAGAADFGMTHGEIVAGKLADRIEEMRHSTTELNRNFMRFRVTFKEQQQILSEFNQAGLTYARMNAEIQKGTSHIKDFSDVTAIAITYSRNLGISTSEAAQKMGEFAFETGMGLQDIAEQFSVITREAMQAGFATKRFYSTIVEVTSGMAFYGVRIDETAKLLKTFDSLLGEAVGTEAFKKIVGQYKDKGAQDRIRELILKDQQFAQEQFSKAFERQIRNLAKTGDKLGLSEDDMRELLQLDEVQMSARLQQLGAGPEEIQAFRRARLTGQAAGGDMGSMVRAMPFAGAGFDVAMASQATQVFGGKRIDEVLRNLSAGTAGAAELEALTNVTGKSLDELEKLGAMFTDMEAAMVNMRDIAKTEASERTPEQEKILMKYAKELGLFIDEQTGDILKGEADDQGKLIKGTEVAVKDALEAVSETTTLGEDQIKDQLTRDQEIATEISRNVTGVSEVLEQSTNRILERIYEAVMVIVDFLVSDEEQQRRAAQLKGAHEEAKKAQEGAEQKRKELADAQGALAKAKQVGDEEAVKAAKEQLAAVEKETIAAEENVRRTDAVRQAVENMSDEARAGQGVGAKQIVDAVGDVSGARSKAFASTLDRALERQQTKLSVLDPSTYSLENLSDEVINEVSAAMTNLEDLSEQTYSRLREQGVMGQVRGEETTVNEALRRAEAAYREAGGDDFFATEDTKQAAIEAFNAALAKHLAANIKTDDEMLQEQIKQRERLDDLVKSVQEGDAAQGILDYTGVGSLLSNFRKAGDLVIPAGGGKPILTDEKDTLMAFKPGGPVAGAMGGRGGDVHISIYGGDQRQVYDTVMKALKAVGRA